MRKVIWLLIVGVIIFSCQDADQSLSTESEFEKHVPKTTTIIPFRKGDQWGFSDKTGKIVLEPRYESAFIGQDGMGRIESGGLTGLVSRNGEVLIKPKYSYIGTFIDGRASFGIGGGLAGFLDTLGQEVIAARYKVVGEFMCGRAIVNDGQQNKLIDKNGLEVAALPGLEVYYPDFFSEDFDIMSGYDPGFIPVQQSERYKVGLIDTTGRIVLKPNYDFLTRPYNGVMVAGINDNFGLIDTLGKTITALKYEYITRVGDTLYVAAHNDKTGLIGQSGEAILSFEYQYIFALPNGHFSVSKNNTAGVVNRSGEIVVPLQYNSLFYDQGYYTFVDANQKMGLMDKDLNIVFDANYDYIQTLSSTRFLVDRNGKRGLVDNRGHIIIPIEYGTEELASEMGDRHVAHAEHYDVSLILLVKEHEGVIYNLNGQPIDEKKWMYLSGPDQFGLYLGTDLNGRLSYMDKDGVIFSQDDPIKTVEVSSVDELIDAIGPNTQITLKGGAYNLSDSKRITPYVGYDSLLEANNLIIDDVANLSLMAAHGEDVHLFIENAFLPVLELRNCNNIQLTGMKIGHAIEPGLCEGAVIKLSNVQYCYINDCDLYGSGTYGIEALMGARLIVRGSLIRECTYGIVYLEGMYNVGFYDSKCRDNSGFDLVDVPFSNFITFDRVVFKNNVTQSDFSKNAFFKVGGHWPTIVLTDCKFEDCTADYFSSHENGVRLVNTKLDGILVRDQLYQEEQ